VVEADRSGGNSARDGASTSPGPRILRNHVPELQTERLLLLPLSLDDAPAIQAVFPQWEVVRQMNAAIPWPYPADGAETFLREVALPQVERGEGWNWSIRPRDEPARLIGLITLVKSETDNRGFWLDPDYWGRGLMTEAANRVTSFWFEELGMPLLRVPKASANIASRRISVKQGMRVVGETEKDYVEGLLPGEIWEITAEEWRAHRSRR